MAPHGTRYCVPVGVKINIQWLNNTKGLTRQGRCHLKTITTHDSKLTSLVPGSGNRPQAHEPASQTRVRSAHPY
ncbi:hypothetical protein CPAR01_06191 [Colletotrichum paranaense]|uniref:Uncharacterized protein n=5 Tax=Colletotrichum acutatum species complex TaxID=2707335 RepID=A0AAI9Z473_9PEZI|nr:uncharacterized protein CCOS01_02846 [Colletotrichum costaricense]XP_060351931.1 uncharacterized protein CPAR01_06191 [Colletotrichum paranaense]XP_060387136.1 uncharacterized protein CTAM01_02465 [Colletotrichum tamarilloi]KAI3552666.1 hypothetical protein CSPX01_00415 [Colletotrichum filicis]KAK1459257.1 hypothetical protein CMEL01_02256 [Colletotrichum melonis]KAK1481468.1 hypothetical protein CCUS01_04581 [Colletotrichum cuscutae]KAK1508679.1 hypothetical protein CTAM01_02465 [Colletot